MDHISAAVAGLIKLRSSPVNAPPTAGPVRIVATLQLQKELMEPRIAGQLGMKRSRQQPTLLSCYYTTVVKSCQALDICPRLRSISGARINTA